jgi:lipoate-protein ligase B
VRPRCTLIRPGTVVYERALAMQHRAADALRDGGGETFILLEHPPVYTLGVRGRSEHVLASESALRARGADVVRTDRGGDVTFHGPGQIVGYPILDLRRRGIGPATYVRMLEHVLIETLAQFNISATRVAGRPGVWTRGAKVAAIGVRVSRGVTTHGFALNVNTDLSYFNDIIPCGIADASVTSMQRELGAPQEMRAVERSLVEAFSDVFEADLIERQFAPAAESECGPGEAVLVGR